MQPAIKSKGCSPPKALPIDTHLQLYSKKIAIVSSSNPIQSDLDLYANGRLEGGIKVAGTGFVKGVGTISPMLECNDPITCSVALLFFVTAGAVGATVGAVTGAVDSPAGGKVDKVEEVLEEKITSQVSQMTLAGLLSEKVAQNPMIDFELVPIEGRATMLSTSD